MLVAFLTGLLIACYRTEVLLPEPHRLEMLAYIFNHQNSDGGLGLHIEGESTMFGTTLNYIAARILGAKPTDDFCTRARKWIVKNGGACTILVLHHHDNGSKSMRNA